MAEFNTELKLGGWQDTTLNKAPKRIIICCDGTWQSSVSNTANIPSNVTRIARYLTKIGKDDDGKEWQQIVYYDAGIGTGVSDLEAKRQGGTGSGFVGNVIEAYNFIVLNYNLGDQIFCFGFSRGAYTARAVAGVVTDIGIVQPRDMQDFPELYRLYQAHEDSHLFRKSPVWREWVEGKRLFDPKQKDLPPQFKSLPYAWEKIPHGAAPEQTRWVQAVGVFDTVGSLGIPKIEGWKGWFVSLGGKMIEVEKFGFHNVALSPYIKHAYHALALDEHRKPFGPTLWHFPTEDVVAKPEPKGSSSDLRNKFHDLRDADSTTKAQLAQAWEDLVDAEMYEELKGHRSKLLQVWFPGVHINIGGGSDDLLTEKISDFEQIAMVTLNWMVEQLKQHVSFEISFTELVNMDRFVLMRPVVDELMAQNKTSHWLMKKINGLIAKDPKNDPWKDNNKTRSKIIAADALRGWATGPIIDSFAGQMKDAGSEDRTPGGYKETLLPTGKTIKMGPTNEQMHPSIAYRVEQLGREYQSVPLKGFKRQQVKDGNKVTGYEWVKGSTRVPEYKIGGIDSFERSCVVSQAAKAFLGKLDKELGVDSWEARNLDAPPQPQGQQPENVGFQPGQAGF